MLKATAAVLLWVSMLAIAQAAVAEAGSRVFDDAGGEGLVELVNRGWAKHSVARVLVVWLGVGFAVFGS